MSGPTPLREILTGGSSSPEGSPLRSRPGKLLGRPLLEGREILKISSKKSRPWHCDLNLDSNLKPLSSAEATRYEELRKRDESFKSFADFFSLKYLFGYQPRIDDEREADAMWNPLFLTFQFVGLSYSTIYLTRECVRDCFCARRSCSDVASMISKWQKCVRDILSDEDHTRHLVRTDVPYAKTLANSRFRETLLVDCRCPDRYYQEFVSYQGSRPVPPFLLDKLCLLGLGPRPTYENKAIIVSLSTFKRTLPPPGEQQVREGLQEFRSHVERDLDIKFDYTKVSRRLAEEYRRVYKKTHVSFWRFSRHSSREFSRSKGGKTGNLIERLVDGFLLKPITDLFPVMPEKDLYDITGTVALRREDWEEGLLLSDVLYRSLNPNPEEGVDERFGQIGLLWSIWTLRKEEGVSIEISKEFWNSSTSYEPDPEYQFLGLDQFRCRVTALPEEGWKVRVITITNLAVSLLGEVARHILDEVIWSEPMVRIGLLDRVKLYSFLDSRNGKGASNWNHDHSKNIQGMIPAHAESVDLTCATDCPDRFSVRTLLLGLLQGIRHPLHKFLTFAVDLATADRVFELDNKYVDLTPKSHNSGIMMGEGLTGVFLNWNSLLVRSLARFLISNFPGIPKIRMTNDDADLFIRENRLELQSFLDSVEVQSDPLGSNSGDDVISFSIENRSNAFKILYRMMGMIPSESTWYSSTTYCTFTEESAIQTFDSKGWKFVDCVKPRVFQTKVSDPTGAAIASKISLLSSYLRYDPDDSVRICRAIQIADYLLSQDHGWFNTIQRKGLPIGLPPFLGGINHPIGLTSNYIQTLLECDIKVIQGLLSYPPLEALSLIWEEPEEDNTDSSSEFLRQMIQCLKNTPKGMDLSDRCNYFILDELFPWPKGQRFLARQNEVKNFKSVNRLLSIQEFASKVVMGLNLKKVLTEQVSPPKPRKSYLTLRLRAEKLRELFKDVEIDMDELPNLSVWKLKQHVLNKSNSILFPEELLDSLVDKSCLPSMQVQFR